MSKSLLLLNLPVLWIVLTMIGLGEVRWRSWLRQPSRLPTCPHCTDCEGRCRPARAR